MKVTLYDGTRVINEYTDITTFPDISGASTGKTGYLFAGWYEDAEFLVENSHVEGQELSEDVNLYAKYTVVSYNITYVDSLSGTNPNPATYSIESGEGGVLTLSSPTKKNFEFDGWYTAVSGGGTKKTSLSVAAGDGAITLYANWKLTVSFDVSGITVKKLEGSSYVEAETPIETNVDAWSDLETLYLFCGKDKTFSGGVKVSGVKNSVVSSLVSIDEDNDIATLDFMEIEEITNITSSNIEFKAIAVNSYVNVVVYVDGEKDDKLTKIGLPVDTAYSFNVYAKPGYKIESSGVVTGGVPKTVTFDTTTRVCAITVGGQDTGVVSDFAVSITETLDTSLTYQTVSCFNNSFAIESKLIEIGNNSSYNAYSVYNILESPNGYATIILKKN